VVHNPRALRGPYPTELRSILSLSAHRSARAVIETWPGYTPSPLHELPHTAGALGVGRLWLKDESTRFGLGAFKSLGGAYAVYRLLTDQIRAVQPDAQVSARALIEGEFRNLTSTITVACASAGNHGRAVAWGARLFGAHCVVHLYQGVGEGRRRAIEELGARVDMSAPDYDEAVRRVAATAAQHGWFIVSDTAYPGYLELPRTVMQGYTLIAQEVLEQLNGLPPTHVILQAGVGGFAAAQAGHFWEALGAQRPTFITVEPRGAACLLESIRAEQRVSLHNVESIMGGLCCGEVSLLAWDVLRHAVDHAVAISDDETIAAMRSLAQPLAGEPRIIAGESGAAGLAALHALARHTDLFSALGGGSGRARVLIYSTEGATDPPAWARYTGSNLEAM
jgi:diaminopropionate ammonia-lyase